MHTGSSSRRRRKILFQFQRSQKSGLSLSPPSLKSRLLRSRRPNSPSLRSPFPRRRIWLRRRLMPMLMPMFRKQARLPRSSQRLTQPRRRVVQSLRNPLRNPRDRGMFLQRIRLLPPKRLLPPRKNLCRARPPRLPHLIRSPPKSQPSSVRPVLPELHRHLPPSLRPPPRRRLRPPGKCRRRALDGSSRPAGVLRLDQHVLRDPWQPKPLPLKKARLRRLLRPCLHPSVICLTARRLRPSLPLRGLLPLSDLLPASPSRLLRR